MTAMEMQLYFNPIRAVTSIVHETLKPLLLKYGKSESIRSDNGPVFVVEGFLYYDNKIHL